MIGNKEKALLHVAKTQLELDDDMYREILQQEAGVKSSNYLTPAGLDKVITRLEKMGFEPQRRYQRGRAASRDPQAVITPAQQKHIRDLYNTLGWDDGNRQIGFNQRVIKKPWPQTRQEAGKIIEGLKAMLARRKSAQS